MGGEILKDVDIDNPKNCLSQQKFDSHLENASIMDCGLKRVNSKRYNKDYIIGKPSTDVDTKKWDVKQMSPVQTSTKQCFLNTAGSLKRLSLSDTHSELDSLQ